MRNFTTETAHFLELSKELANQIFELNEDSINESSLGSVQSKMNAVQNQIAVLQYLSKEKYSATKMVEENHEHHQQNPVAENFDESSSKSDFISSEETSELTENVNNSVRKSDAEQEKPIEPTIEVQKNTKVSPEAEKQALADQFMNKGIDNLGDHIGISEKFMFIHELFKGDTEHYIKELTGLNNCSNTEDVNKRLEKLSNALSWDQETTAYLELKKLIDRKYPV